MTPPQIIPQPHITESITNETTVNYPNQEQTTTRTHGFKHHSLPTTERVTSTPTHDDPPPKPSDTNTQQSSPASDIAHETHLQKHITTHHIYESQLPPDVWAKMTDKQRRHHTNRTRKNKSNNK